VQYAGQKMMILKYNGGLSFGHARVQHSHRLLPEFPEGMMVSSEMPIRRRILFI
jgi:hypothetical protein